MEPRAKTFVQPEHDQHRLQQDSVRERASAGELDYDRRVVQLSRAATDVVHHSVICAPIRGADA
jgi:hypothetical protein